jgi:Nucleotidyl transferase AbiEii toxin, Type IV TA system
LVGNILTEIDIEHITVKKGNRRKTVYEYEKQNLGDVLYGQVRDNIILETTWLGHYEPFQKQELNSLIGDFLLQNGNEQTAKDYNLRPFMSNVLKPERTLCEKIMSLVRFSYSENPIKDLKLKIRHCYDLHQILQQKEFLKIFHSTEFDVLLLKTADDDVISFKNNNQWLKEHPNNSLIFKDIDAVWEKLKDVYNKEFKQLVFGKLPNELLILETLKEIKQRLEKITWTIKIDPKI